MRKLLALSAVTVMACVTSTAHAEKVSLRAYAGPCLARIIDYEGSGWNPTTYNGGSHYIPGHAFDNYRSYGLPQALPGSKMRSAGRDWATNPYTQIRWMRGYARSRYGSECGALVFWQAHHWY